MLFNGVDRLVQLAFTPVLLSLACLQTDLKRLKRRGLSLKRVFFLDQPVLLGQPPVPGPRVTRLWRQFASALHRSLARR
jgi:hypothetical protein